ncbi:hypothetical protein NOR51B_2498 [Luminiphilus syltensis NOR5-1B]|uniref:beta-N-acetylhexosaminidase n=1 Tax=Luminiphilus syltensis NOR5-1B TaxID=565045 RepID=B8KW26_9GAMM|nr:beta-N-acetylhexosaminidase [Luminiphilus syltensis]EED36546.1 hypothetical protein NOR51B_2498 [Luminiphilus syltensis NOR5-1B]
MLPAIFGFSGPELTPEERAFFRQVDPLGYILFARNVVGRTQLKQLTASLRDISGRSDVPILIDQEGGRVARMGPPEWSTYPAAGKIAALFDRDPEATLAAMRHNYRALGLDLAEVGISVDCAPVLDVPAAGAHSVIGDRALGTTPEQIGLLGGAVLEGLADAGVVGVIKHIPGHGRAEADSHQELPVVNVSREELARDLAPFQALAGAPMAMTAHIRYPCWDTDQCATLSATIIRDVIRGQVGFDGLLMSDDLDMKALHGSVPELASEALRAGCDVALNCWGDMAVMRGIAEQLPEADSQARRRLTRAMAGYRPLEGAADIAERRAEALALRDRLLAPLVV